ALPAAFLGRVLPASTTVAAQLHEGALTVCYDATWTAERDVDQGWAGDYCGDSDHPDSDEQFVRYAQVAVAFQFAWDSRRFASKTFRPAGEFQVGTFLNGGCNQMWWLSGPIAASSVLQGRWDAGLRDTVVASDGVESVAPEARAAIET